VSAEHDLQVACIAALERIPDIMLIRQNSGRVKVRGGYMRLAPGGTPDLQVLLPAGETLFIELKPDKPHSDKRVIERQRAWRERVTRMGHTVLELRSVQGVVDIVMQRRYAALRRAG
jgi:hypothetical protein